jgi:acyl-CoA thioesterase FadM
VTTTGAIFVVTDTQVSYLRPARLDDLLDVTVQSTEAGRASMQLRQQAWRGRNCWPKAASASAASMPPRCAAPHSRTPCSTGCA